MAKRATAVAEKVVDPTPPEPSQSELAEIAERRLTGDSLAFLEKCFPDPARRNWLQVLSGLPGALGGGGRAMELCRYRPEENQWVILGHLHSGKDTPVTLGDWLVSHRRTAPVSFCPSLSRVASDQSPLHPLSVLFCRVPVKTLPHVGSGAAFQMANLTGIAEVKRRLYGLEPLRPSLMVTEWTAISCYWVIPGGIPADMAAPLLAKIAMLTKGEFCTPRSFMALPGQHVALMPRRTIEIAYDSGTVYTKQDMTAWLGEGTPIRSREEMFRDPSMALRRYWSYQ